MKKLTDSLVKKFFKVNYEFTPKAIVRFNDELCSVSFGPMKYELGLKTYRDWSKIGKVFKQHLELNIFHDGHCGNMFAFYDSESFEIMQEITWEYHDKHSDDVRKEHEYECIDWLASRNDCTISEVVIEKYRRD